MTTIIQGRKEKLGSATWRRLEARCKVSIMIFKFIFCGKGITKRCPQNILGKKEKRYLGKIEGTLQGECRDI